MVVETATRQLTLGDVVEQVIAELKAKYPTAEFLMNDEVYGEEDIDIDAYVNEELIVSLDKFANELTYRYWEQTGYDIFVMVAPRECYPIKE
jgi:hypothetical protein